MFKQARAQFGNAVKSFWFYEGELCPACSQHPIGVAKFEGKDALHINGFMYRERGVLIVGSGNMVHNLRTMRREAADNQAYDWAIEFDRITA